MFANDVVGGVDFPSVVGEVPQSSCFERGGPSVHVPIVKETREYVVGSGELGRVNGPKVPWLISPSKVDVVPIMERTLSVVASVGQTLMSLATSTWMLQCGPYLLGWT